MSVADRNRLKNTIQDEITKMFGDVLDFADVAITSKRTYTQYRSKVLKAGNDAIRNLHRSLEEYTFERDLEDVELLKIEKES